MQWENVLVAEKKAEMGKGRAGQLEFSEVGQQWP